MAKKARKKVAAKATKTAKRKSAPKRKAAVTTARHKTAAPKKAKAAAKQQPAAKPAAQPRRSIVQRIEGAVSAVFDTLTDAERLHHKLDPGISPEPE